MKTVLESVLWGLLAIVVLGAISFLGYESYSYFAPKYMAVDSKVFHESAQYNDGMIRDLESLQMQYISATDDQKAALKAVVLHRFSVYPEEKLPANLRNFYNQLKGSL